MSYACKTLKTCVRVGGTLDADVDTVLLQTGCNGEAEHFAIEAFQAIERNFGVV